ncbi:MAG TPA: hypothetical protein VLG46_05085 [Anaerolineae bacterium]|nr:hypothetical protein [Anaerolineae bacterium]
MPIKLNFEVITAIIQHGVKAGPEGITDPSTNPALAKLGVAMVTTYIEQLSFLGIIRDPVPLFGSEGGMWIGYRLTERGMKLSNSEQELRLAVADLTGDTKSEVAQSVRQLHEECLQAHIDENYKQEFLRTLEEIAICFDAECYIAAMGLCGKILEACLKEMLCRYGVQFDPNSMIGVLLKTIKEKIPSEHIDPALTNIAAIINQSRITAVHTREKAPLPSRDQVIMVIFAMRDIVRRNLA